MSGILEHGLPIRSQQSAGQNSTLVNKSLLWGRMGLLHKLVWLYNSTDPWVIFPEQQL